MKKMMTNYGIRPNSTGDWPKIDPTAFVDSSAQIIGSVRIAPNVYIETQIVIRADETDAEGRVHPISLKLVPTSRMVCLFIVQGRRIPALSAMSGN